MKDRIIEESIKSLREEGLKFSVDTLSLRLKISKKTVYKYFPTKEALAYAVYERFYLNLLAQAEKAVNLPAERAVKELLSLYYQSCLMVRDEIFNKYALNAPVKNFADAKHGLLWKKIGNYIEKDAQYVKAITDGAFRLAATEGIRADGIIDKLAVIIC